MQIIFRPLEGNDLFELRTWFEDAELSRRLSFPTDEWFVHVTAGATAHCWVALDASGIIAVVQAERLKKIGCTEDAPLSRPWPSRQKSRWK